MWMDNKTFARKHPTWEEAKIQQMETDKRGGRGEGGGEGRKMIHYSNKLD